MAVGQTTFSDLSVDAMTLIKEETLSIIEKNIVLAQHAMKISLPQHNSKTIQFTRYKRLPLPQTTATEGVTGSSTKLENEIVTAIVDQWIMTVELSDYARLTIKHPLVPIVEDRLGTAQAELVEREVYKSLLPSPVVFAANRVSRGTLTSADVLNALEMRKLWATLRRNGARMEGAHYLLVADPEQSQDIANEQKFIDTVQFAKARAMFNNEIGEYLGFRVQVSNSLPLITAIADAAWSVGTGTSGGVLGAGTYPVKITAVDNQFGYEHVISSEKTIVVAGTGTDDTITVTVPSTTGFTYNVYLGAAAASGDASLWIATTGLAPSAVYTRTTAIPSTGAHPPATPPMSAGVGTVTVHTAFVFGREAFGMVKLSGDNLRVLSTPDVPSDSDPALQRKKISLKGSFKSFILNNDYLRRFESASAF